MAGIKGKDTRPEIRVRKALHAAGLRYRLHVATVPGKPDLVFPSRRAVIFINGCFWHGHGCSLFRLPSTRTEFWKAKIARNRDRDIEVRKQLTEQGWRHLTVWECAFRGPNMIGFDRAISKILSWIDGMSMAAEVRGKV